MWTTKDFQPSRLKLRQTAALGLFNGLNVQVPNLDGLPENKPEGETDSPGKSPLSEKDEGKEEASTNDTITETKPEAPEQATEAESTPEKKDEDWVVVLGGASSVGKYGIQVGRRCSLRILA